MTDEQHRRDAVERPAEADVLQALRNLTTAQWLMSVLGDTPLREPAVEPGLRVQGQNSNVAGRSGGPR